MQGEQWKRRESGDRWLSIIAKSPHVAIASSRGRGYLYRPDRLVVDRSLLTGDVVGSRHAQDLLRSAGAFELEGRDQEVAEALGLVALGVNAGEAVPTLVSELRAAVPAGASLDHVLVADPRRFYGCDPAEPADPSDLPPQSSKGGEGMTIAVLDTGIYSPANLPVDGTSSDEDALDDDTNGLLDPPSGHGTFVAGIVLRWAPGAKVLVRRVLTTPAGIASELEIASALLALPEVDLINCSFGGLVQSDAPPLPTTRAIAALPSKTVVVASAGNSGDARPRYPAASKGVVGVAWVEGGLGHEGWSLADESCRGPWVDACAPGSDIVSQFVDFDEPAVGTHPARRFVGAARWSGTSFSAPAVTASIAAVAARDGIPAREASYRLISDPDRLRIADGGTLVLPGHLPPAP